MKRLWMIVLVLTLFPGLVFAETRRLKGQVLRIEKNGHEVPEVGLDITLKESGDTGKTKAQGLFRIFLPDVFKAGESVTLLLNKPGWVIHSPLDGEVRVPDDLKKAVIEIRLLPSGSKKLWSSARIEKLIQDLSEDSKKQVKATGKPEEIDFSRFIRDWAVQYGFSASEAKKEIDQWIAEVEKKEDNFFKLGLAASAKKNFAKAGRLLNTYAESKAKELEASEQKNASLREETVQGFRKAGDANYNNYDFEKALKAYERALNYISKEQQPKMWATVQIEVGRTNWELGVRVAGPESKKYLAQAVVAYRSALTIYTQKTLPQNWAWTQNNLGTALQDQGTRTAGKGGTALLAQAITAYRSALTVRTQRELPQNWAATQNNLGIALNNQGTRTAGKDGAALLAQAVTTYRSALTVRTQKTSPQHWATTQNNLGVALQDQGIRTAGKGGADLLAQAVAAYRSALTVRTQKTLPQHWAGTQNNLGIALKNQGTRTAGKDGAALLAQAVAAYLSALTIYTKKDLPQHWAMTQNNLGTALRNQDTRTVLKDSTNLLAQAVAAYRNSLTVYTKKDLPQHWAMTQNNLGVALQDQSIRTAGKDGADLLAQAVVAYRGALTVYTQKDLPQQWAATQNNLGIALQDQGIRTAGKGGTDLLAQAVAAYRSSLTVRTQKDLPQQWAATQNNLGATLRNQGIRTAGKDGTDLLAQAISAFRNALTVRTQKDLPQHWAMTQNNLAKLSKRLEDWSTAAESFANVLHLYPKNAEAYKTAAFLYHEKLFNFQKAFELNAAWAKRHEDIETRIDFAQKHFTTGRFSECEKRINGLLENPELEPRHKIALQAIQIANTLPLNKTALVPNNIDAMFEAISKQNEDFRLEWHFEGTKQFIRQENHLAPHRNWLLKLFNAVEGKNRNEILKRLKTVRAAFQNHNKQRP